MEKIADKDNSIDREFNSEISIWLFVVLLAGLLILLVVLCKRIRDQRLNDSVPELEMTKSYRDKRKAISREIFKSFDRQKELHRQMRRLDKMEEKKMKSIQTESPPSNINNGPTSPA